MPHNVFRPQPPSAPPRCDSDEPFALGTIEVEILKRLDDCEARVDHVADLLRLVLRETAKIPAILLELERR